jgi:hypothetical protein
MRKRTLIASLGLSLVGAGAFALAAAGGGKSAGVDVMKANAATARASSVHYSFTVKLLKKQQPLVLHISGGATRDAMAVHLRLADVTLSDGTTMPGATGAVMLSKPFLYERAPDGVAVYGNIRWLRLHVLNRSPRSQVLSTVRSMTPSPLLRIVAESRLHPVSTTGSFAGTVAYDDPVVRTALHTLGGGLEFRNLRVFVSVGKADGLIHRVQLTGRTADGKTGLSLRARFYGFGTAVTVKPPKPGTFMDQQLSQLGV